jgi:hypothetical protein
VELLRSNILADTTDVKATQQKPYEEEDDIIRFRAHINQAEFDEKLSPFFFRNILTNRADSNVNRLKTDEFPEGTQTREETMEALETHYKRTFSDSGNNARLGDECWNGITQISEETKFILDKDITKNDLTRMIYTEIDIGKLPGDDGLTVELYRKFWLQLNNPLMKCMEASWAMGHLTDSQKRSVICLIAKKGKDQSNIKGWRPISLLNCDMKIFAKIIACRFKRVCRDVIGEEQLAYIKGCVLQDGHMVVNKVLELARKKKVFGLIGCIDIKGAFDQIQPQAIWDTLEHIKPLSLI